VPEQAEDLDAELDAEAKVAAEQDGRMPTSVVTADLIRAGESKWVEFKQTGRVNVHTGQPDKVMGDMVVRAVAGFMNAEGGILLLGVTDTGDVSGIEVDLKT